MEAPNVAPWGADWAWAVPLIVSTVVFHAYSLGLVNRDITARLTDGRRDRHLSSHSAILVGGTALSATVLHGIEVATWAASYRLLRALPDIKSAMLYSMNAMTSYGHVTLYLDQRWQMMGSLESLNGWILFGLTTAFLYSVVQRVWSTSHLK